MPAITKQETRLKLEFVANTDQSIHAGLVAVEAMARNTSVQTPPGFGVCPQSNAMTALSPDDG